MKIPRIQTFDSLIAHKNYRHLWMGNFCANTSIWLQLLTLGWLVKYLTDSDDTSALFVVGIGGMTALPGLIIGPFAAVLGDKLDRRKLVIFVELLMFIIVVGFGFLTTTDLIQVWHVYCYAFLAGTREAITFPVRQALIANTVPRSHLSNAFATSVLTIPGTRMLGPFVGGILLNSTGFFWNFMLEGLLYLGVVLSFWGMKTPYTDKTNISVNYSEFSFFKTLFGDVIEGLKYLWFKQRVIPLLYFLAVVPNGILHSVLFLLPMYTANVLLEGPDYGGYLMAMNGLGGFLMVLMLSAFGFPSRKGFLCLIAAIGGSVLTFTLSFNFGLIFAFIVLASHGITQTIYRTTNGLITQTLVKDEFRVRANSLYRISNGSVVFFVIAVGWLATRFTVSTTLLFMGSLGIFISLLFFGSKKIRNLKNEI